MAGSRRARMFSSAGSTALVPIAAVVLLCLGLRVGAILVLKTYQGDAGAYEHRAIAQSLAEGKGFRYQFFANAPEPSSHQAPAVPVLLSLAYRAFGIGSPEAHLATELFFAGLSAIGAVALVSAGSTLWSRPVGLWAATVFSLHPPLIYAPTRIQAVNWAIPFFLAMLAAALRLGAAPSFSRAAVLGVFAALGILGEPILAAPFALACLHLVGVATNSPKTPRRRALGAIGVGVLIAGAILLPWMMRNYQVHDRVVFVKDTFWYVFWQGNHLSASGTDKVEVSPDLGKRLAWQVRGTRELEEVLTQARHAAVSVDGALDATQIAELRSLPSEIARMDWFRSRALAVLRSHPFHYLRMCGRRLIYNLWFDPTNPRSFALPYRLSYLLLVAFAIAGGVLARSWPPSGAATAVWLALGLLAVYTTVITSARFRLVLEAVLVLPAAVALWRAATRTALRFAPSASKARHR